MNKISNKWLKIILWVGSYINILLFALVGGYIWIKTNNEDVKNDIKKILWVTIIFTAIGAFLSIFSACMGFGSYNADASKAYSIISSLVVIAKIVTYLVFIILVLVNKKESNKDSENSASNE